MAMAEIDYFDVYYARRKHRGFTHKQRQFNYGVANFHKFLLQHPSSEEVIIDGQRFLASIVSNKQDQSKLTKKIAVEITTPIHPGSIIDWKDMKWIVYQRQVWPNETAIDCYMVRCNQIIKWFDNYGVQCEQYAYIVGPVDSVVKQNFRTWNKLITPQPNIYLQMLIPSGSMIGIDNKFIIGKRAWMVVEYDSISVPGITYYSLVEDKIDKMDDSVDQQIANLPEKNSFTLQVSNQTIQVDVETKIPIIVYDQGVIVNQETEIINKGELPIEIAGETVNAPIQGTTNVQVRLKNQPKVAKQITLTFVKEEQSTQEILEMSSQVKLMNTISGQVYKINGVDKITVPIIQFIAQTDLAEIKIQDGKIWIIANSENRIGSFDLVIKTQSSTFNKTISVRSLW